MTCAERLQEYMRQQGVPFELHQHRTTYTSDQMAAAEHIPGKKVAKAIIGLADGRMVMLVLPSTHMVDYSQAAKALGTREFRLASESEFANAFADCDVGAVPIFGNLYNLPVYVDEGMAEDESITFPAGSHIESMTIQFADFERLVKPTHLALGRLKAGYAG